MMRTVLFLDVDGVLNCHDTRDKCCGYVGIEDAKVALLADIVNATNADIVLSSTWRHEWKSGKRGGSTRLGRYLEKKLNKYGLQIYDKTPDINWRNRALEINAWMDQNQPIDRIIILDDEDFYYPDEGLLDYWICTQSPFSYICGPGLTQENVDYIINNIDDFNLGV